LKELACGFQLKGLYVAKEAGKILVNFFEAIAKNYAIQKWMKPFASTLTDPLHADFA
jgi:hypothetical protein